MAATFAVNGGDVRIVLSASVEADEWMWMLHLLRAAHQRNGAVALTLDLEQMEQFDPAGYRAAAAILKRGELESVCVVGTHALARAMAYTAFRTLPVRLRFV